MRSEFEIADIKKPGHGGGGDRALRVAIQPLENHFGIKERVVSTQVEIKKWVNR